MREQFRAGLPVADEEWRSAAETILKAIGAGQYPSPGDDPRDDEGSHWRDVDCGEVLTVTGAGEGRVAVEASPGLIRVCEYVPSRHEPEDLLVSWGEVHLEPFMARRLAETLADAADRAE